MLLSDENEEFMVAVTCQRKLLG